MNHSSVLDQVYPRTAPLADECLKRGALQKRSELAALLALVAEFKNPVIVEIGSDAGGTLYGWRQLSNRVYSISLRNGPFSSFAGNTSTVFDSHGATCLDADSHDASSLSWLVAHNLVGSIDVLFLDGDHTLQGVAQDWNMYSPLVRPGGIVALHDICWHGPDHPCQVDRFWTEVLTWPGVAAMAFIDFPTNWGGIGVVQRQ